MNSQNTRPNKKSYFILKTQFLKISDIKLSLKWILKSSILKMYRTYFNNCGLICPYIQLFCARLLRPKCQ